MKIQAIAFALLLTTACGGDADSIGVGASCSDDSACGEEMVCLPQFRGGACGLSGCSSTEDCPADAVCAEVNGEALCLRGCIDKPECNANRSTEDEANCSANLTLLGASEGSKVCVPPSSG